MVRFRLRFLLQEIDLGDGETVIGRSPTCHVTIEDPLVSRRHAIVRIRGEQAVAQDLGSRNGLLVNGRRIEGMQTLVDGDRLRVGTQELVFCVLGPDAHRRGTRPTGFLCRCAHCSVPYPAEAGQCPQCGSVERLDDDTLSGVVSRSEQNWTLQLLLEVLERAIDLGRWDDVERLLHRSRMNVEERLAASHAVDRGQLEVVADAAVRLAVAREDAHWAAWVLDIYNTAGLVPGVALSDRLSTLPPSARLSLAPSAHRLVKGVMTRGGPSPDEREGFSRLEALTPR